jgi:hypothetical protein
MPKRDTLFTVQNQRAEDKNGSIMMELGHNLGSKKQRAGRARGTGLVCAAEGEMSGKGATGWVGQLGLSS